MPRKKIASRAPGVFSPQQAVEDRLEAILDGQPEAVAVVARELLRVLDSGSMKS